MTDATAMGPKDLLDYVRKLETELARVHVLLDSIEVPHLMPDSTDEAEIHQRIIWLIHQGVQRDALATLTAQRDLGNQAIDRLKKLAALYAEQHGPVPKHQTHPWTIVRWVKEHLR